MKNHFLYLNTHRLSAYAWQGGRLLPEGVFAKSFTLTMKGKFRIADQIVAESVTKSGVFPELHEKK